MGWSDAASRSRAETATEDPAPRASEFAFRNARRRSLLIRQPPALGRRVTGQRDAPAQPYGESGTGQELLAHGIDDAGARAGAPFIAIDRAAILARPLLAMTPRLANHDLAPALRLPGASRPAVIRKVCKHRPHASWT
ncbi:MAG TPA: sigma 54-interacting transcriptional regulator [Longimicrobiales bacterium]